MAEDKLLHIKVDDLPDYDVIIVDLAGTQHGGPYVVNTGRWWWGELRKPTKSWFLRKDSNVTTSFKTRACSTKMIPEHSKVLLDQSCKIPATLVKKRYEVVTNRTPDIPDYIVFGDPYRSNDPTYSFTVLVSESQKKAVCAYLYCLADNPKFPTLEEIIHTLQSNLQGFADFSDFVPYDGNLKSKFCCVLNKSEYVEAACEKLIPKDFLIVENCLVTGTQELTAELLYSCYKMLESPDSELRKTAMLTLANSKYFFAERLIAWILSRWRDYAWKLANSSSTVKWMCVSCNVTNFATNLVTLKEIQIAKEFLTLITDGSITFSKDETGTKDIMHCKDINKLTSMSNHLHSLRKAIPNLMYDLETANALANN